MGFALIPVISVSVVWGVVAIICPFLVPKGPNQSVTRCSLILTGILCWLFWLCCYMTQMNPLVGPKLNNVTIVLIAKEWGNSITNG